MARPKKKLEEIKLFQINLRVTLNEQVQLEEIAKTYGLYVVEFIRRRALQKQLPKHSMLSINRALLFELSRIGNNLNQLTKKANQNHPDVKGLNVELLDLNTKLNELKTVFLGGK